MTPPSKNNNDEKNDNNNNTPTPIIPNLTRISDADGFIGTILYVGPVASASDPTEKYLGISWDDSTRGKHDGSVICRRTNDLVRHFHCDRPTQGSFLRPRKANYGVALTEEVVEGKYARMGSALVAPGNRLPHFARTARGKKKPIELVGEEKIRKKQQIENLEDISLRGLGIARAADPPLRREVVSHLKELDLAGNLLAGWEEVVKVLTQFPNLRSVSVANNRITMVGFDIFERCRFPLLEVVNLNGCSMKCDLKTLRLLDKAMPNLKQLCLANNDMAGLGGADEDIITTDAPPLTIFQNMTLLDLSGCQLHSWDTQISIFNAIPNLHTLILDQNHLQTIPAPRKNEFPSLTNLQLASNAIDNWSSISHLSSVPHLASLRFRNNPLTSTIGAAESRCIVIARLPHLRSLNASPITTKERTDAERRYIRSIAQHLRRTTPLLPLDHPDVVVDHPRLPALLEEHKDVLLALSSYADGDRADNLHNHTVNVTITSMASGSCTMGALRKRLPSSFTVGRLKSLCARAFDEDVTAIRLHFRIKGDPFPMELDDDDNPLSYYNVVDGAEILLNERDVDNDENQDTIKNKELHDKITQEERQLNALREHQIRPC